MSGPAPIAMLYETNARDVVACMRQAADNIEKDLAGGRGMAGDIRGAVFCVAGPNGEVSVYSWGALDNYTTLGVLVRALKEVNEVIG